MFPVRWIWKNLRGSLMRNFNLCFLVRPIWKMLRGFILELRWLNSSENWVKNWSYLRVIKTMLRENSWEAVQCLKIKNRKDLNWITTLSLQLWEPEQTFTSSSFSFFFCEMGTRILTFYSWYEDELGSCIKLFITGCGTKKCSISNSCYCSLQVYEQFFISTECIKRRNQLKFNSMN